MVARPDDRIVEEQAALRRVATLVAAAAGADEVFGAVAAEVGRLLEVDFTVLIRSDPPDMITVVGTWTGTGAAAPSPVGSRFPVGGRNVSTLVLTTDRPARLDAYADVSGAIGDTGSRAWRFRSSVGVPIAVEDRPWGLILVAHVRDEPLPADTEERLAGFTELVATAVSNAQARLELRRFAEEQAALRRMATLVAAAAAPEQVFDAVAAEAGRLLDVDFTILSRTQGDGTQGDGTQVSVGAWSSSGTAVAFPVGTQVRLGGRDVVSTVVRTGRPARIDYYADATGPIADDARGYGFRTAVGVPINVEGRPWGGMAVGSARAAGGPTNGEGGPGGVLAVAPARAEPLPPDAEARLAGFTELVGTAIANAEAQAALAGSRSRIVAAADTARRRIERDLHDGAQQRLVSLALQVRAAQAAVPPEVGELGPRLDPVVEELTGVLDELREIARGLHPAALAEGGLRLALKSLARRSAVPVRLDVCVDGRLPEPIELAAFYAVSEALTNT